MACLFVPHITFKDSVTLENDQGTRNSVIDSTNCVRVSEENNRSEVLRKELDFGKTLLGTKHNIGTNSY